MSEQNTTIEENEQPRKSWYFYKEYYLDAFAKSGIIATSLFFGWIMFLLFEENGEGFFETIGILLIAIFAIFLVSSILIGVTAQILYWLYRMLGLENTLINNYRGITSILFWFNFFLVIIGDMDGQKSMTFYLINLILCGIAVAYYTPWFEHSKFTIKVVAIYMSILAILAAFLTPFSILLVLVSAPLILTLCLAIGSYLTLHFKKSQEAATLKKLTADGVEFTCHSCATDIAPTHCYCPNCNQQHQFQLIPNEYGIFHQNCTECNHPLSTQFMQRKALKMKLYCSTCQADVDNTLGIDKHLILIGNQSTAKTDLCLQMVNTLRQKQLELGINTQLLPALQLHLDAEKDGQRLPSLSEQNKDGGLQLLYKTKYHKYPYQLHLYDVPTNLDHNETDIFNQPFYKKTDSIVFIIDPFDIPNFRKNNNISPKKSYGEQPLNTLRSLLQTLDKYKPQEEIKSTPINIILSTKNDYYLDSLFPTIDNDASQNVTIEEFIKTKLEGGAFIHHVKQQFDNVNYYMLEELDILHLEPILNPICEDIGVMI